MSKETFDTLMERVASLTDVYGSLAVLGWDQRTHMPNAGTAVRSERISTLVGIAHDMATNDEMGSLITGSENYVSSLGEDSVEAANYREITRQYEMAKLIPGDLQMEIARANNNAYQAWVDARTASDFSMFQPFLEKNIDLIRKTIECLRPMYPDAKEDYDILLDDYERGMTSEDVSRVFGELRDATVELAKKVSDIEGREKLVHGTFPRTQQDALIRDVLKNLGFDDDSWNLSETTHPFESSMSIKDIRITTKYDESFFNPCFFGSIHEFGHGLYERQIDEKHDRTILAHGVSLAWHESQSRMWENLVGRSEQFADWVNPLLKKHMPDQFGSTTGREFYRSVNAMGPSAIRIEADELTYNLHIILRFELERDITNGTVAIADLPRVWNERMSEYLGYDVKDDAEGVLQDVHWSQGSFGYFSTYALGNVLSAMLWEKIDQEIPDVYGKVAAGEFAPLREWLGTNIHQYGAQHEPKDLLERVLGTRDLDPKPLIRYLSAKVDNLYS